MNEMHVVSTENGSHLDKSFAKYKSNITIYLSVHVHVLMFISHAELTKLQGNIIKVSM